LLIDLLSVDNTLKQVTVVSCPSVLRWKCGSPIELINNKLGQKGGRHLISVELIHVVLKDVKS